MKKLLFFLLLSVYSFSQTEADIDKKLDSLNIKYVSQMDIYNRQKNTIVDGLNLLIYNGKYDKKTVSEYVSEINDNQYLYEIPFDIKNEARAIELKNAVIESTNLTILAEKTKLLAEYYYKLEIEIDKKYQERVLKFLRETNYSPSSFKKLSENEREKLLKDFENKK